MFELFRRKKSKGPQGESGQEPAAQAAEPTGKAPAEVLAPFLASALPDAIDGLAFRVAMGATDQADPVTGFERYAARLMDEAGAAAIRAIAVEHPLEVIRLDATNLFWLNFDDGALAPAQRDCVLATEAALNRLALTEPLAAKVDQARSEEGAPRAIAEEECSLLDWRLIRTVADGAPELLDGSAPTNKRLSQADVEAPRGGNWDVLTRLAGFCEEVKLPFRLPYRLDADVKAGAVALSFVAPSPSFFPTSRWDAEAGRWADTSAERPRAAAAYCLRVAMLLAAAAFGASVGVARAVVSAREGDFEGPTVLSCEFARMAFMMGTLPAIARGDLGAQGTEWAFDAVLALAAPSRCAVAMTEDGCLGAVEPLDAGLPERRTPMEEDDRPLPEDLARLLRADTVRELDVLSPQDKALVERMDAIMADSQDAPLLAIAQLEEMAATLEEQARAALEAARRPLQPLYCDGAFARYLVSLVSDDESQRFLRVGDMHYAARLMLARLYQELGDEEAALAQAHSCVELAPSSPSGYQRLVTVLAGRDDYDGIIDAEKRVLRIAVAPDEVFYAYYRLAYAFWRTGQRDLALACYLSVPTWASVGEMAAEERNDLLGEMPELDAEGFDRNAVLRSGGVPLAPTKEVLEIMATTAIRFCEEGMPLAAAPGTSMLGNLQHDDALSALAVSLRLGA